MKKAILIFLFIISAVVAKAQDEPQLPPDIDMLKYFYTAYMVPFVSDGDLRVTTRKQALMRRAYCTPRCLTRYQQLLEQTDGDPFIKAQDSNMEAIKSLEFAKHPTLPNRYIVTYTAADKVTIDLGLVKEKGEWKIDYLY